MSKSTKRKFVAAEVTDSFDVLPDPEKGERIVRILAPRGNNLHEVEAPPLPAGASDGAPGASDGAPGASDGAPDGAAADAEGGNRLETFLVSMPNKFRKNIWVKRGDFVVISRIPEGDKVRGEIRSVLYKEQIKYIKSEGKWPAQFEAKKKEEPEDVPKSDDSDSDDDDDDLFKNTNRPVVQVSEDEDDDSDEEDEQDRE